MLLKRLCNTQIHIERLTFKEFVRDKRRSRTPGFKKAAVVRID